LLIALVHYATLMAVPLTLSGVSARFILVPIAAGFVLEVVRSKLRRALKRRVRARFLREVTLRALDKRSLTADADVEAAFWAAYMVESAVTVDAPAVLAASCAGVSIFALAVPMLGRSLTASLLGLLAILAALTVWSNRRRIALVEAVVRRRQLAANWIAAAERDCGEIYGERAREPFLLRLGDATRDWSAVEDRLESARLSHRILLAGTFFASLWLLLRWQKIDLLQLASSQALATNGLSGLLLLGTGLPAAYVFVVHADLLVMAHAALTQIFPRPDNWRAPSRKLAERPRQLTAQALSFRYPSSANAVFENLSFDVDLRTGLLIIAPNGGGKTTLGMLICGVLLPDAGSLRLDGIGCSEITRDEFGFVPQNPLIVEGLSIEENIRLVAPNAEVASIERLLAELGLEAPRTRLAGQLSRGQQRRIAIARAILKEPRVLLLDEPDAWLDSDGRKTLAFLLRRQSERSVVIVISHRRDWLPDDTRVLDLAG
jgi:ABC-type multidrug transport system fused ATPase/permease subunit